MASAVILPTSISSVQTDDRNMNQMQNNIAKAVRHIQNQAVQAVDSLQKQVNGITASQINSQTAGSGAVLEADGSGGSSWVSLAKCGYITSGTPGTSPAGPISNGTRYTLIFTVKQFDTASAYNTSTGVWTCPAIGIYDCHCSTMLFGTASSVAASYVQIGKNGSGNIIRETLSATPSSLANASFTIRETLSLVKGDTIQFCIVTADWTSVSFTNANYVHWMSICQRP